MLSLRATPRTLSRTRIVVRPVRLLALPLDTRTQRRRALGRAS
jgi:hypothetical protein